jgi:hypothetical protein
MPDDLESLYHLGRSHATEAYDKGKQDGIEHGINLTKICIAKWLLDKGAYKSATEILKYILSLSNKDITTAITETKEKAFE